ncbi:MAG: SGNH/GDSL hydrolase family protein [bacterium]|nr:SGNH/GDSL hydrolase family protein [bacterium]
MIENNATVLFQGDSITDAGRYYDDPLDMGTGYASMAASRFGETFGDMNVTFLNRGISGNRAIDLQGRWESDCLMLKPNWVSIMIGVNDAWRRYDSNDPTSADDFAESYRDILTRTRDVLGARLIILEPFVLLVSAEIVGFREDLDPKIEVVRSLADEFGAIFVPLDQLFAQATLRRPAQYWSDDGVHPTPAGHHLIAEAWLDAINAL